MISYIGGYFSVAIDIIKVEEPLDLVVYGAAHDRRQSDEEIAKVNFGGVVEGGADEAHRGHAVGVLANHGREEVLGEY